MHPPDNIVAKEKLPIEGMNIVRTKQGDIFFVSLDGRYIFQGRLFDVWNGEEIESAEELERLSGKVDLDHLGVREDRLFSLDVGSGNKEVHVFVDPLCHHCRELVKDIRKAPKIRESYVFRIVITPISSQKSRVKAHKLAALANQNATQAIDAFVDNASPQIKVKEKSFPELDYNLLVARALSIQSVPCLISPDGRIRKGRPDDLAAFLHPVKPRTDNRHRQQSNSTSQGSCSVN